MMTNEGYERGFDAATILVQALVEVEDKLTDEERLSLLDKLGWCPRCGSLDPPDCCCSLCGGELPCYCAPQYDE